LTPGYNVPVLSPQTAIPAAGESPRRSRSIGRLARLLDLVAGARTWIVVAGLAAAVLLPQITLSSRLPSVRVEQLLLPYALLLFVVERSRGSPYRAGWIDWLFGGLAISTAISIMAAPLILHLHLSPRDFYELLKLLLYYGYFRLALSASAEGGAAERLQQTLLVAGLLCAVFAVAQYFDWLRIDAWLSPLFAPEHHLTVLRLSGRVVGSFANPNYLGIFCAMLLLAALLRFWLRPAGSVAEAAGNGAQTRDWAAGTLGPVLLLAVGVCAALGLVMTGSRTALLGLVVALGGLLCLAGSRRLPGAGLVRFIAAGLAVGTLLVAAVAVVEIFPRGGVDYLGRIGGGLAVNEDASFGLRLARWRSVIDAWLPGSSSSELTSHNALTSVHATGVPEAPADVLARDAQRKSDLLRLASAIDGYRRTTKTWPPPAALDTALVPRYIASIPLDPASGQPYDDIPVVTGYSLLARLENPADPDYPIYGVGSSPNYLLNGGFELGDARPADWDAIPGSKFARQSGGSLYGEHAVLFRGSPDRPQQRGGIFQQRYFGRPGGNPFTATVWIKLPRAAPGSLDLYANVVYTDGDRADPLTRIPADMSKIGVWQKVSLGILPPAGKTLAFMGIYVVSSGFDGDALLDGFQLVDGPVPLDFAITREAPPSDTLGFNPEAQLRRSPIIGVGPEKGEQGSSLDDEYLLYAARYGLIGIVLYLALYLGTLVLALRAAWRATTVARRRLAVLVAATLVAFLVFNITAGSFYEIQLMAIFWLLAGAALAPVYAPPGSGRAAKIVTAERVKRPNA